MLKDFLLPRDVISDYCGGLSTQLCWNPELLSTYRMYVLVFPNLSPTLERFFDIFLEENISFWVGFVAALFANAHGKKKTLDQDPYEYGLLCYFLVIFLNFTVDLEINKQGKTINFVW